MTNLDSPRGYAVNQHDTYLELHYRTFQGIDDFDQGAKDLLELASKTHITRLLLVIDLPYDAIGNEVRIEGLNLAQGFKYFDKIAVCAADPKQLDYLKRAGQALRVMNLLQDPDNFEHFASTAQGTAWLVTD